MEKPQPMDTYASAVKSRTRQYLFNSAPFAIDKMMIHPQRINATTQISPSHPISNISHLLSI
jgi:hypothetical protein